MANDKVNTVRDWLEGLGAIVASLGAVGGVVVLFWKRIAVAYRCWMVLRSLYARMGSDAADRLAELFDESQRLRSELLLRLGLLEKHLEIGTYLCDSRGQCVFASPVLCEMYGLDSQAMGGHGWLAAVNNSEKQNVLAAWIWAIDNDAPYEQRYGIVNQRTGRRHQVYTATSKVSHGPDNVFYLGYVKLIDTSTEAT